MCAFYRTVHSFAHKNRFKRLKGFAIYWKRQKHKTTIQPHSFHLLTTTQVCQLSCLYMYVKISCLSSITNTMLPKPWTLHCILFGWYCLSPASNTDVNLMLLVSLPLLCLDDIAYSQHQTVILSCAAISLWCFDFITYPQHQWHFIKLLFKHWLVCITFPQHQTVIFCQATFSPMCLDGITYPQHRQWYSYQATFSPLCFYCTTYPQH